MTEVVDSLLAVHPQVAGFLVDNSSWLMMTVGAVAVGWYLMGRSSPPLESEPPTITGMSAIEFIHRFMAKDGHQFLLNLARGINCFSYRMPGSRFKAFVVADHQAARSILESPKSIKTPIMYDFFDQIATGETFFAHNGKRALHVRKSTATAFASNNVKRMTTIIEEILEKWIEERLIPHYVHLKIPIDMDEEIILITTDIMSRVAFDHAMTPRERQVFVAKMHRAMKGFFGNTNVFRTLSLTSWMFPGVREAQEAAREIYEICANILQDYRRKTQEKPQDPNTLIAMLVHDDEYVSDVERTRDMISFFFGGFDTTAHALAWALLELARHPEEQHFLRAALQKCATKEEAQYCSALKNVIRETLRMYPPAALGSIRTPGEDIAVVDPVGNRKTLIIPAGSICIMPYYVILRNGNVFPYPDSFVPSRWERQLEEQLRAFLPFAAGRRNCQGQALATTELRTILCRLCRDFEFSVVDEGRPEYFVTLKTVGTKLMVTPVSKQD